MTWLYREVPLRWPLRIFVCVLFACSQADRPAHESQVARSVAALGQAGSGDGHDADAGGDDAGNEGCTPRDSADTTCDGVDDDCDGKLDEDCEYGPSLCPPGTT